MRAQELAVKHLKRWVVPLSFAVVTGYCAYVAYPTIFTGYDIKDDAGYLLVTFQSYLARGGLYSSTYTNYGPGYYSVLGSIFQLARVDLMSLVPGRVTALTLLVVASLAGAFAVWLATRRLLLAIAAQLFILTFQKWSAAAAPLHPGGYLVFLLGLMAVAIFLPGRAGGITPGAIGVIVALLLTTKINVGAFALIACAIVAWSASPSRRIRAAALMLVLALPIGLTITQWHVDGVLQFALVTVFGALVAYAVIREPPATPITRAQSAQFVACGALAGVLACVPVLLKGTSVMQLLEGMVLAPVRFPGLAISFQFPIDIDGAGIRLGLAAPLLGAAVVARRIKGERTASRFVGFLKLVGGIELLVILMNFASWETTSASWATVLPAMLVLSSLVAVPVSSYSADALRARRMLLMVSVFQLLHIFPVPGSQVAWGAFLMAPIAFINVGDGLSETAQAIAESSAGFRWLRSFPAAATVLLVAAIGLREELSPSREYARFAASAPLALPGAEEIRLPLGQAIQLREVTRILRSNCDTFYSLPGLGSFYVWTQMQPPTGRFVTSWYLLFDDDTQAATVQDLERFPGRLCMLWNQTQAEAWITHPIRVGTLLSFVHRFSEHVGSVGDYEVLRRPAPAGE